MRPRDSRFLGCFSVAMGAPTSDRPHVRSDATKALPLPLDDRFRLDNGEH